MRQYELNIVSRLPYVPESFLLHAGVKHDFNSCISLVSKRAGALIFFYAPAMYGKTHLALRLESDILALGRSVKMLSPGELAELMLLGAALDHDLYIVDDAHLYLESVKSGESGPFVTLAERLKLAGKTLILLSQKRVEQFNFDHHLASRIKAGSGFTIGIPESTELSNLLRALALQRGLNLSSRKLAQLTRNAARSIPGLIEQLNTNRSEARNFEPCLNSQKST